MNFLGSLEALHALYSVPSPAATRKEAARIIPEYRRIIEAAPFLALATAGPEGLDCSPRGDRPGQLVRILDETTLALPDLPTPGRILAALTAGEVGGERCDADWPERAAKTMW